MKKIISLLLCVTMLMMCTISAGATEISSDIVKEKKSLRQYCIENNLSAKVTGISRADREDQKQEIYQSFFCGEMDVDTAVEELEKLGVYALQSTITAYKANENKRTRTSSPTALSDNPVTVYYDTISDTWELGAGIWWNDDSWREHVTFPLIPMTGINTSVGGFDGLGIVLYDASGTYEGCTLEDTWLYVATGDRIRSNTSHTPTGNIGARHGVFHEFQDYVFLAELAQPFQYYYFGKHMAVFAKYSSEFENYHGYARLQYVHTWESSYINSIGVNIGNESAGFSIGITNQDYSFTTLGSSETYF